MNTKNIINNIIILVVSSIVVLVILEILFKSFSISNINHNILYNDLVGKMKPFAEFEHRKENINKVRLNNLGFHDYNQTYSFDGKTVLVLGDSFTEALQVPIDSNFVKIAENKLQNNGLQIRLINGGLSGSSTAHEYHLWKYFFSKELETINEIVLVVFLGNDLQENSPELSQPLTRFASYIDEKGEPFINIQPYSWYEELLITASNHSVLANLVKTRLALLRIQLANPKMNELPLKKRIDKQEKTGNHQNWSYSHSLSRLDSLKWFKSIDNTLTLIDKWNTDLFERNKKLKILIIYEPEYFIDGKINPEVKHQFLEKLDSLVMMNSNIVTEKVMFEIGKAYDYYSFDGNTLGHFNYKGHRVAATYLIDLLNRIE